MTYEERKAWIDGATYEQLLSKWRFATVGSPWFQGKIGKYYSKVMFERKKQIGGAAAVTASKAVGWDR